MRDVRAVASVSEKKRKTLLLARILLEETDESHVLTLPELLRMLDEQGVRAERKSLYDDMETLRSVGLRIETRKERNFGYYVSERLLSEEELRLLARAVSEAAFLSPEERDAMAGKLAGVLCSRYRAGELREWMLPPPPQSREEKEKAGEKVTLEYHASCEERVRERFGDGPAAEPAGKNRMRITVRTPLDDAFFAWLFLCAPEVRLVSPKKLAEQFRERAKTVSKLYK